MKSEEGAVVVPLLATQILWINLVTDGAPALALGLDPPDADVMNRAPRPSGEPVVTRSMSSGCLVGAVMATGTLLVFDASLPGGLFQGAGDLRGCWADDGFHHIGVVSDVQCDERALRRAKRFR